MSVIVRRLKYIKVSAFVASWRDVNRTDLVLTAPSPINLMLTLGLIVRAGAMPLFEGRAERGAGDPVLHWVGV